MRLATELGPELGVPTRLANTAFAEMTEALNRGWENRDSRSPALLQLERCGLKVEVDPQRTQEVSRPRSAARWRSKARVSKHVDGDVIIASRSTAGGSELHH